MPTQPESPMSKSKEISKEEYEEIFDFSEMGMDDESYDDHSMSDMMHVLMESSTSQMKIAMELTKLMVETNLAKYTNEDDVLSAFRKAAKTVHETHNLNTLMDQLGTK